MTNRFPHSLYSRGSEPDPRFSLANERTFLAWIRTSLALLAAGVALEALQVPVSPGFRLAAAVVFIALGVFAAVHAWLSWLRTERALRENRALPSAGVSLVLVAGVVVAVVLLVAGFFW
jgi:putative membrane protein